MLQCNVSTTNAEHYGHEAASTVAVVSCMQALAVSEAAARPLWSLDVPELKTSTATDLAATGPVSLLFAGIVAGCALYRRPGAQNHAVRSDNVCWLLLAATCTICGICTGYDVCFSGGFMTRDQKHIVVYILARRGARITAAKLVWSDSDGAEIRSVTEIESSVLLAGPLQIVGDTIAAPSQDGTNLCSVPTTGRVSSGVRLERNFCSDCASVCLTDLSAINMLRKYPCAHPET